MIYVCGDTHIPIDIYKIPAWVERVRPTIRDILIIVGDFGLLWNYKPDDTERFWTDWFNNQQFTTLFIDGNHENFERLNRLKEIEMFGSVVGKVSQKIYHLKRGNVYTIEDKKIFTMGGAESIDKQRRQPYIS